MLTQIYDIGGMHCAACSSAVERVTRKLPGVAESSVNLPMNRLTITYDEAQCSPEDIIRKVEKAGFTAALHNAEPEKRDSAAEELSALRSRKRELIASVILAALLLTVSMGHMLFPGLPLPTLIDPADHAVNFALVQLLLALPVLLLGRRFFSSGFRSLLHLNPNMDTLVALSSSASFLYSLATTFLLTDRPELVHNLYFESSAVVVALVSVGKYLEERSREKTKSAIRDLMALTPDTALLVDENGQWEVPTSFVKVGDTLLVKPGARVPLDGVVLEGQGSVNEAMLTGESLPVDKSIGSELIGGSISVNGALTMRVTRIGEDTTLSGIIRFVEDAQGKKAPISRTADKVAGIFVPVVMAVALLSAGIWLLCGAGFGFALKIFTCVLVIACPCAMGLATPTAIIVGTGLGAKNGILIRSGEALETCHKVTVAIFDKTGTVTRGTPEVTEVRGTDEAALLTAAASLESLSDHPLSAAVLRCAEARDIAPETVTEFESLTGRGLAGRDAAGEPLLVGSEALLQERGVMLPAQVSADLAELREKGRTAVAVARGSEVLGVIGIADTIREDSAEAVAGLKELGIKTVLLTGDNRAAAEYIAAEAGIGEVAAEVLPTQKAEVVRRWQERGETVLMVGDGINDAPALVQADVGCAIGNGSDIAIDAAELVLMRSRLTDVCRAVKLSRLTIRNIRQNLFWAFCYNTLGIPIAAGALYPAFGLLLSPMVGGLAMSLSSLFVVTNALRLKGKKL